MPSRVKIYMLGDFIRKTASGELDRDRSLAIVRELAAAAYYHKEHNIMLDLRETDLNASLGDLIQISMAFASYKEDFSNKIAVLIPNTEKRIQIAKRFKACMDVQGFEFRQFVDFESAIEWLSVVK